METKEKPCDKDLVPAVVDRSAKMPNVFVPDTGYSWVILTACFVANMLQFGYQKAFGLLFVKFLEEFHAPVSLATSILGVFEAVNSLASLFIMGVLLDYWSLRAYSILGAFLSATGVALSAFAMNIEYLIFSHSFLVGIGYAFSFGPMFVLISRYFKKRRALAFAISSAGISAGGMTTPLIISTLLENFSLQNTLLIFSALMSLVILCATLYRDPTSQSNRNINTLLVSEKSTDESSLFGIIEPLEKPAVYKNLTELNKYENELPTKCNDTKYHESSGLISIEYDLIDGMVWRSIQGLDLKKSRHASEKATNQLTETPLKSKARSLSASNFNKFGHNLLRSPVSEGTSSFIYASSPCLTYNAEDFVDIYSSGHCKVTFSDKCRNLLDLNLFKNPFFWFIAGFTAFGRTGLVLAEVYIPSLAQENGLSEYQSSVLLCIIGALDVIFRIIPGVIIEFRMIKAQHIVIFSLIVMGTVFQFISFFSDFTTLIVLSCLYGIFGGSYFTLLAVILIDVMSLDDFGKIFGFVQIFHGVSSFALFPAAGVLKDTTGTYNTCFQFLGACMIFSSIILLLEPLVQRHLNFNNDKESQTRTSIEPV